MSAIVAPAGASKPAADTLTAHVAERLADYKKPRTIVFVTEIRRSPSGKADLQWAREVAARAQHS